MGIWKDGILSVVTGDALGCPVEFSERAERERDPVTGMRGHGTYDMPAGTWTDDSSMTLATLDSLIKRKKIDLPDIMDRFGRWLHDGKYTPFGNVFDVGIGTAQAIERYRRERNVHTCGGDQERDNGNGSLMRILPACLFGYSEEKAGRMTDANAVSLIRQVSALTHRHLRSEMACGLYFFMTKAILEKDGGLIDRLQAGLDRGFDFYKKQLDSSVELAYFARLQNLYAFRDLPETKIRSTGYVIDTIEASIWCLITTTTFPQALLTAVNLGLDTDTVAAIAGGLAGLYYGVADIPEEWLAALQRRNWIEKMAGEAEAAFPI